MRASQMPLVSILIVTHNHRDDLKPTVASLRRLDYPKARMELLVLDNGSTDGTGEWVRELFADMETEGWARLELDRSEDNLGVYGGRARALGSLSPRGEWVLSVDDDVEFPAHALGVLLPLTADPRVGAVGARVVYLSDPGTVASAAGYFNRWLGTLAQRDPGTRTPCDFVIGCFSLFRREALERAGGFDPDYYTSHGDVDVCLAIGEAGYRVIYEPALEVRHDVPRGGTRAPERLYYLYRNKAVLIRKHSPPWWRPVILGLYALAWPPRIFAESLLHHRGIDAGELRALGLALLDALLDRRGRSRWFRHRAEGGT